MGELKRRGYRLAVIKHAGGDFEIDQQGKDSWRLAQAGSDAVILSSPSKVALLKPVERDLTPIEVSTLIGQGFDLILTEGFKGSNLPKIEVHRKELGMDLVCSPGQLFALVTDEPLETKTRQFPREDVKGLANLLEEGFIKPQRERVSLYINNAPIPLSTFPREFITNVLLAMVSSLKGVGEVRNLELFVRREPKQG